MDDLVADYEARERAEGDPCLIVLDDQPNTLAEQIEAAEDLFDVSVETDLEDFLEDFDAAAKRVAPLRESGVPYPIVAWLDMNMPGVQSVKSPQSGRQIDTDGGVVAGLKIAEHMFRRSKLPARRDAAIAIVSGYEAPENLARDIKRLKKLSDAPIEFFVKSTAEHHHTEDSVKLDEFFHLCLDVDVSISFPLYLAEATFKDFREVFGLSVEQQCRMLGVNPSEGEAGLARLFETGTTPKTTDWIERLEYVYDIVECLATIYTPRDAKRWMNDEDVFSGTSPLEAITSGRMEAVIIVRDLLRGVST